LLLLPVHIFVVLHQFSQVVGEWLENQILIPDWTYFYCPGTTLTLIHRNQFFFYRDTTIHTMSSWLSKVIGDSSHEGSPLINGDAQGMRRWEYEGSGSDEEYGSGSSEEGSEGANEEQTGKGVEENQTPKGFSPMEFGKSSDSEPDEALREGFFQKLKQRGPPFTPCIFCSWAASSLLPLRSAAAATIAGRAVGHKISRVASEQYGILMDTDEDRLSFSRRTWWLPPPFPSATCFLRAGSHSH